MIVRAARVSDDFIEAEIREYRRRENELRQQTINARASTSAAGDAKPMANTDSDVQQLLPLPSFASQTYYRLFIIT